MRALFSSAIIIIIATGCGDVSRRSDSVADETGERVALAGTCYQSLASILGRSVPLDGHSSVAPGWLRFADD